MMIATHKLGTVPLAYQDLTFYRGHLPVELDDLPEVLKILHWKGPRIPGTLIETVKSFFSWTYKTYHTEAVVRLYLNEHHGDWVVVVMPQEITGGLSVTECKYDTSGRDEALEFVSGPGWYEAGTIHHHCSASAFQSGTDFNDEKCRNGIQITFGNLASEEWSIHMRGTFRNAQYEIDPREWFELPDQLTRAPLSDSLFPEPWKGRMKERPKPPVQSAGRFTRTYHPSWHDQDDWYNERDFPYGANQGSSSTSVTRTEEDLAYCLEEDLDELTLYGGCEEKPSIVPEVLESMADVLRQFYELYPNTDLIKVLETVSCCTPIEIDLDEYLGMLAQCARRRVRAGSVETAEQQPEKETKENADTV